MIDQRVSGFNEYAEEYTEKFADVSLYRPHLDRYSSMLAAVPRVLDLACGPANVSEYILSRRDDAIITCVDIAPAMIEIARKKVPSASFVVSDIREYAIEPGSYDVSSVPSACRF